jgi:hypothetical protein
VRSKGRRNDPRKIVRLLNLLLLVVVVDDVDVDDDDVETPRSSLTSTVVILEYRLTRLSICVLLLLGVAARGYVMTSYQRVGRITGDGGKDGAG